MALTAELPHHVLYRVLREKIHITNLMPLLKDVNTKNINALLKWVFADEDWILWQVQNSVIFCSLGGTSVLKSNFFLLGGTMSILFLGGTS